MTGDFTRRICVAAIGAAVLPRPVDAQQARMPTIGVLDSSAATAAKLSAFYGGLKVEGFSRNQNVTVEYHSAQGDYAQLPALAADLVARRMSLITAFGTPAALAAKAATATVPIVFAVDAHPIQIGLVDSLNHPGANLTGVAGMAVGREHKRLELLHASAPTAPLLGLLVNPQNSEQNRQMTAALAFTRELDVQIKLVRASTGRDCGTAFTELAQSRADGLVIADDDFFLSQSAELGLLAARHSIPAIFQGAAFTAAGGLMSYGTRLAELYHQAGTYTGLVLAGAVPADLPIYQSTAVEMIVNLRSAKSLGIILPQAITDQANMLIQ